MLNTSKLGNVSTYNFAEAGCIRAYESGIFCDDWR